MGKSLQGLEPQSTYGDVLVVYQCGKNHDWAYTGCVNPEGGMEYLAVTRCY